MIKDIRLIVVDLDGTLITGHSWRELNTAMGVTPAEDQHYYNLYHQHAITYRQWIDALLSIYHQHGNPTRENINAVLLNYTFAPGAREALTGIKACGYRIALISGAMDIVVKAVASELGIQELAYNSTFYFDATGRLSRVDTEGEEARVKLLQLRALSAKIGIRMEECLCVGDSHNDRLLFWVTGHGVTFDHCHVLHDCCWQRVPDWTALAELVCE